ncbi:MAG: hypothetical protein CL902_00820 [Dehalococcoidia bacterium]|nr:hypothetical protein [Dehalococcoidia bacterium]
MASTIAKSEYDQQAVAYSKCKRAAWRTAVEMDIAQRMFRDHATPDEITYDLACGDGFYTRWLASSGLFENIIGIDISPEMIALAKETDDAAGSIEYLCADVHDFSCETRPLASFAFSGYLLSYASSESELISFLTAVRSTLREGGGFCTVQNSTHDTFTESTGLEKYGIRKSKCTSGPMREWDKIRYDFFDVDTPAATVCSITNYYVSPDTLTRCALRAGFEAPVFYPAQSEDPHYACFIDRGCIEGVAFIAKPVR